MAILALSLLACDDPSTQATNGAGAASSTTSGESGATTATGTGTGMASTGSSGAGGGTSAGCAKNGPRPDGQLTISVDGEERSFFAVPATATEPTPLVLSFHGYGGTGQGAVGTFGLVEATAGGATLLFPDGVPQDWYQNAVGWDTRSNDTPDIHFVQALIADALANHCVDPTRIYVVGFSWGGWMSNQVACALGDEVRAFVSVAGGGPADSCKASTRAMIVHGASDDAEPIASGEESRTRWITRNGCAASESATTPPPCVASDGCSEPVLWCKHAGGHEVPQFVRDAVWGFLEGP